MCFNDGADGCHKVMDCIWSWERFQVSICRINISCFREREIKRSLPMFHAFTGCDETSFFTGKGKKTAWSTWEVFDDVTEAFTRLMNVPTLNILDYVMPTLERFIVLLAWCMIDQAPVHRVATFQTTWNSLTFPWLFQTKIKLYRESETI